MQSCAEIYVTKDCSSNCIVYGDSTRAVEVIQNIIENAIKYGDGKSIKVSAKKEEETYVVSIKNTGCTLEKREIAHICNHAIFLMMARRV